MSKNIYVFSGLGADERVFHKLDLPGHTVRFIKWKIPQKHESIENYASRLLDQITTTRPILIGLSFGGLISIEIAKQIEVEQVILIASAKTKLEIPYYYRWAGKMRLHHHLPLHLLKKPNTFSNFIFRDSSPADRVLLHLIFADTNPIFLKWAIDKVVRWSNQIQPPNIKHIHGTADRIFPIRYISCDLKIKDGGHLLTLKNSEELSEILRPILRLNNK